MQAACLADRMNATTQDGEKRGDNYERVATRENIKAEGPRSPTLDNNQSSAKAGEEQWQHVFAPAARDTTQKTNQTSPE